MKNIYTFGLSHLFSKFSVQELKSFCDICSLTVDSSSIDTLIDSLIEGKDYMKPKTKKKKRKKKLVPKNQKSLMELKKLILNIGTQEKAYQNG